MMTSYQKVQAQNLLMLFIETGRLPASSEASISSLALSVGELLPNMSETHFLVHAGVIQCLLMTFVRQL